MKKKNDTENDDRTVVNMNVEGMPWYVGKDEREKRENAEKLNMSGREKRAAFRGALRAYLPMMLCILGGFALTVLLMWLWLK